MRRIWTLVAGAGALLAAGCPFRDIAGLPSWELYGTFKADVAIDSDETLPADGDYVWYVSDNTDEGNLIMGLRDSRIGARMGDPETDPLTARFEVDFHEDDVLVRHFYVEMDLGSDTRLIVGQTDDVFAPRMPDMLNWSAGWYAGNVGERSPQIKWRFAPENGVNVDVALSEPQDNNTSEPDFQARVGWQQGDEKTGLRVGASAVFGDTDRNDNDEEEDLAGFAIDFNVALGDRVSLSGEWYKGRNLDDYMGQINETAGFGSDSEISGTGLWLQCLVELNEELTLKTGYMLDRNDTDDLGNNDRQKNSCFFVNLIVSLNDSTDVGIEVSKWETDYWNAPGTTTYDNRRIQASVIMRF